MPQPPTIPRMRAATNHERFVEVLQRLAAGLAQQPVMQALGAVGDVVDEGFRGNTRDDPRWKIAAMPDLPGTKLPMDEASRMARAQQLGFDTPVYHYTDVAEDFPAFRVSREGVYTSTRPEVAEHAGRLVQHERRSAGRDRVMPMMARGPIAGMHTPKRIGPIALPEVVESEQVWNDLRARVAAWAESQPSNVRRMAEDVLRNGYVEDGTVLRRTAKRTVSRTSGPSEEATGITDWQTWESPRSWGYPDTVPYQQALDEFDYTGAMIADEGGWSPVIRDPRNLRSRFAAFDPAKANSADLLASLVALFGGASAMRQQGSGK